MFGLTEGNQKAHATINQLLAHTLFPISLSIIFFYLQTKLREETNVNPATVQNSLITFFFGHQNGTNKCISYIQGSTK